VKNKKINIEQEANNQQLGWSQILVLLGNPIWDVKKEKWRILNGYQSVMSNTNNQVFFEITFTDTPYWENFAEAKLYLTTPQKKEKQKENGDKGK
jgi:hypothetical protein